MWTLKEGHWCIAEKIPCARCGIIFKAGDYIELHNAKPAGPHIEGSKELRHVSCPKDGINDFMSSKSGGS